MPRPEHPTAIRATPVRVLGFVVAVALGAIAIWLIVTGKSQKKLELGVLAGLWGVLIGAFAAFGTRRHGEHGEHADGPGVGSQLELRSRATEVEAASEVAARRAEEQRLQEFLRDEIRSAVNREVSSLRAEIAELRTELLEKVGGQLRLEHIETTRVIGSDLEALQDEIRALKVSSRSPLLPTNRAASAILDATVVEREVVERAVVDSPGERPRSTGTGTAWQRRDDARPAPPSDDARPAPSGDDAPRRPGRSTFAGPLDMTGPIEAVVVGGPSSAAEQRPAEPTAPGAPTARQQPPPPASGGPASAAPAPDGPMSPAPASGGPASAASASGGPAPSGPQPAPSAPTPPSAPAPSPASPPPPAPPPGGGPEQQRPAQRPDPFADLPRLSRFVDEGPLPPSQSAPQQQSAPGKAAPQQPAPPQPPRQQPVVPPGGTPPTYVRPPTSPSGHPDAAAGPRYEGRRRRSDEQVQTADAGGGRRRRAESAEQDNLLQRLLERERS